MVGVGRCHEADIINNRQRGDRFQNGIVEGGNLNRLRRRRGSLLVSLTMRP